MSTYFPAGSELAPAAAQTRPASPPKAAATTPPENARRETLVPSLFDANES
jgi:hypothetical protein